VAGDPFFFDAGMFIGALLRDDPRHAEARPIVKAAYYGELPACTSTGILSEVYVHLTNERAVPRHSSEEAADAITKLVAPPSMITVVPERGVQTALRMLSIARGVGLRSRDVHDARHAATALDAVRRRSIHTTLLIGGAFRHAAFR
jgi:predicted nucleic acid-binding protein